MGFNPEDEKSNLPEDLLQNVADEPNVADVPSAPDSNAPTETLSEITLPNGALDIDKYMNDEQPVTDAPLFNPEDLGLTGSTRPNLDALESLDIDNEVDETLMDLEQYRKHYRKNNTAASSNTRNMVPLYEDQPKKKKKKKNLVVPIILFLVLLAVGGGLVYFAKNLKDRIVDSTSGTITNSSSTLSTAKEAEPEKDDVKTEISYITGCKKDATEKIYEQADKNSPVVAELQNGDTVYVIVDASEGGYSKVKLEEEGMSGYVRTSRLVSNPAFVADASTYYINVEEGEKVALLKKTSPGSDKVGSLTTNQKVTLIAKASVKYWYVYSKDLKKYGYVDKDLIETSKYKTAAEKKAEKEKKEAEEKAKAEKEAAEKAEKEAAEKQEQQQTSQPTNYYTYYVSGVTNYLALRNAEAFDANNEIGAIYNGTEVQVINTDGKYWYVYVPSLGLYGYVNGSYLSTSPSSGGNNNSGSSANVYYASVATNYLALRNAKAYAAENEIGKIYNGDKVEVLDSSTGTYWYVYVPSLGMKGYVNSGYLTK